MGICAVSHLGHDEWLPRLSGFIGVHAGTPRALGRAVRVATSQLAELLNHSPIADGD